MLPPVPQPEYLISSYLEIPVEKLQPLHLQDYIRFEGLSPDIDFSGYDQCPIEDPIKIINLFRANLFSEDLERCKNQKTSNFF